MGTLYVVPTPIGNLEDITLRALRILREVRLIAAEDTRTSRVLLDHFEINTPMTSYHEHNKLTKLDAIFDALAQGDVALIADAGTPGISDPGYELIQAAIAREVPLVPLPGANAILTALVGSGLPSDSFVYLGFLPKKVAAVRKAFAQVADEPRTLIAYESPHRLTATLAALRDVLGERPVCVAREMSKRYETFFRGPVSAALGHFTNENPKGEITLVVGGQPAEARRWSPEEVREALRKRLAQGDSRSQAAKTVATASGWRKSEIYDLSLD